MSESVALTFIASGILIGFVTGWIIGVDRGVQRGRDQQWMDDFFNRIEKEKQRRDKLGRFKTNKVTPPAR